MVFGEVYSGYDVYCDGLCIVRLLGMVFLRVVCVV